MDSMVLEILKDYKKANKRMFIITIILCFMVSSLFIYNIYITKDIGTVETTTTQEIKGIDSIDNSNIANGDINGNDKTNTND